MPTEIEVSDRLRQLTKAAEPAPLDTDTVGRVCRVDGLTQEQLTYIISACYMVSTETGKLEPPQAVWKKYSSQLESVDFTEAKVIALWRDPDFMTAVYKRGIRSEHNGLDARMILALQVLTDYTAKGTPQSKLRKIGVRPYEYQAWLNYPTFRDHLTKLSQKAMGGSVGNAKIALANKAVDGDLNAIKFLFEVTGEHDPNKQAQFDGERLVRGMADIMMKYIKDPVVLREIAGQIQILLAVNGVAQ